MPESDLELEVWYPGVDRFAVDVFSPEGNLLISAEPGISRVTLTDQGEIAIYLANRLNDPNNHDNAINVFFSAGMPEGGYRIRLRGVQVTDGRFHAWIERDNDLQSRFADDSDNTHTIGSISCGRLTIAVGSYDGHKASLPLSYFSSAGPTRDGRHKPEVSAPGHDVLAARSSTRTGVRLMSGTSMAAPALSGIIAMMLAEARARGLALPVATIRDILLRTARRTPPAGVAWHDRYGQGRVSAAAAIQAVIDLAGAPPVPVVGPQVVTATEEPGTTRRRARTRRGTETHLAAEKPRKVETASLSATPAGDAEVVELIVKVSEPDYLPDGVEMRARIDPFLFTCSVSADRLAALNDDPRVISIAYSKAMYNG